MLDLFCKAGGAAMGLHRAWPQAQIVGVDIEPQPRYPFTFVQADATTYQLVGFDFIWASPPCQAYSALKGLTNKEAPQLVSVIRERLEATGVPWIIENVVGADLKNPIQLCGSMFGLGVWRHRRFEMSTAPLLVPECRHDLCPEPVDVTGTGRFFKGTRKDGGGGQSRKPFNLAHAREVMGIEWMTRAELNEAIPPAYSEYLAHSIEENACCEETPCQWGDHPCYRKKIPTVGGREAPSDKAKALLARCQVCGDSSDCYSATEHCAVASHPGDLEHG